MKPKNLTQKLKVEQICLIGFLLLILILGITYIEINSKSKHQVKNSPPICGDGNCDEEETIENCSQDCEETPKCAPNTRYIDATQGNDNNDGLCSDRAWKYSPGMSGATGNAASYSPKPGDSILFKRGEIWNNRLYISSSGTEGNPITYSTYTIGNKPIIDGGDPIGANWVPAPEVGEDVYKTTTIGYEPTILSESDIKIPRIYPDLQENNSYFNSLTGFQILNLSASEDFETFNLHSHVNFWDVSKAIAGYSNGTTYIRYRDGDNPNTKNLKSSPANDGAINIEDKSYITVQNLEIRNAHNAIMIMQTAAHDIVIENCTIMNGIRRVRIYGGSNITIRNNEIFANFLSDYTPGAWNDGTVDSSANYSQGIRDAYYNFYKYLFGGSESYDYGVAVYGGTNNALYGNTIHNGLEGVYAQKGTLSVFNNSIYDHSSIGIVTLEGLVNGEFHDNLIYNNNINLRLQWLNVNNTNRTEYYYRNRLYEPNGIGTQIYLHFSNNSLYEGDIPKIYFYHNSFSGGYIALPVGGYFPPDRLHLVVLNNIFSSPISFHGTLAQMDNEKAMELVDYNWVGGNITHKAYPDVPAWFGEHNLDARGEYMWPLEEMPDFLINQDNSVVDAGIDLSQPFTFEGATYEAMPGMNPNYYFGAGPDMGAIEYTGCNNNGICDSDEDIWSCSQDCSVKDYIDSRLNESDSKYLEMKNFAEQTIQTLPVWNNGQNFGPVLQSKINSLPASGGTIVLNRSRYNINSSVSIGKSNVIIKSANLGDVVLNASAYNNFSSTFFIYADNITIENLIFISENMTAWHAAVRGSGNDISLISNYIQGFDFGFVISTGTYPNPKNTKIVGNYLFNNGYLPLNVGGVRNETTPTCDFISSNNIIENNLLADNYQGITVGTCTLSTTINGNIVRGSNLSGFRLETSSGNNITGNIFHENGLQGIWLYGYSHNNTVENNIVLDNNKQNMPFNGECWNQQETIVNDWLNRSGYLFYPFLRQEKGNYLFRSSWCQFNGLEVEFRNNIENSYTSHNIIGRYRNQGYSSPYDLRVVYFPFWYGGKSMYVSANNIFDSNYFINSEESRILDEGCESTYTNNKLITTNPYSESSFDIQPESFYMCSFQRPCTGPSTQCSICHNNNICEPEKGEWAGNCPNDCPAIQLNNQGNRKKFDVCAFGLNLTEPIFPALGNCNNTYNGIFYCTNQSNGICEKDKGENHCNDPAECNCTQTNNGIELCDGIDNNCDGKIDESCTNCGDGLCNNGETCSTCSIDCGACQGGGGGGSGGGGDGNSHRNVIRNTTQNRTSLEWNCNESWFCEDFGPCIEGLQTRTCIDTNNCGTENTKPEIMQNCNGINGGIERGTNKLVQFLRNVLENLVSTIGLMIFIAFVAAGALVLMIIKLKGLSQKKKAIEALRAESPFYQNSNQELR
jgi:parallel beta-helix repeat protein